jgi:hypothetical protein
MDGLKQRALAGLKRSLVVAASALAFALPSTTAVAAAIVNALALLVAFVAVCVLVIRTRPGMSFLAWGPTEETGKARESRLDHFFAQVAAILMVMIALVAWAVAVGLKASGEW